MGMLKTAFNTLRLLGAYCAVVAGSCCVTCWGVSMKGVWLKRTSRWTFSGKPEVNVLVDMYGANVLDMIVSIG